MNTSDAGQGARTIPQEGTAHERLVEEAVHWAMNASVKELLRQRGDSMRPWTGKVLLAYMALYSSADRTFEGQIDELARHAYCSPRLVRRWLRLLVAVGRIEVLSGPRSKGALSVRLLVG